MTLNQIMLALANIKDGQLVKVHYRTIKGDYTKETEGVYRFVQYDHIANVQAKGKANPNEKHITTALIYNAKNDSYYLQLATANTPYKAKVKYYYQGNQIDKATYDLANPTKARTTPLVIFRKNINDIISIG